MMKPRVSILVPIYGVEAYIEQCLHSLFGQDYSNLEFVFVNDCTKDNSIQVLQQVLGLYPERENQVILVDHIVNKGLSAARNTALEYSSGEYVLIVDSDDFLSTPIAVTELVEKALAENDDAVYFESQNYPNGDYCTINVPSDPQKLLQATLARTAPVSMWGCLYRRSLFMDHNVRSIEDISMGEDYAVKPRLVYYMNKIGVLHKTYYCYRLNNNSSITSTGFQLSKAYDLQKCILEFRAFFKGKDECESLLPYIDIGIVKCKVDCLRQWAYSDGTSEDYKIINKLFKPKRKCYIGSLSFSEHLIYLLSVLRLGYLFKLSIKLKRALK